METFRMNGYRPWLERAIRVDEDNDWSVHTIDYAGFKRKLRFFSKRRTQLRRKLAQSSDDSIVAIELDTILGPPPQLPAGYLASESRLFLPTPRATVRSFSVRLHELSGGANNEAVTEVAPQTSYVAFPEEDELLPESQRKSSDRSSSHYNSGDNLLPLEIDTGAPPFPAVSTARPSFWGPATLKRRAVMRQVSNYERNDMMVFLAMELDSVAMFYISQWQALSQRLIESQSRIIDRRRQQLGNTSSLFLAEDPQIQQLANELLELEAFVVINLVTVRQILIRYDAFARTFEGTPMLDYYMKMMLKPQNRFFRHNPKEKGGALSDSFRKLMQHAELTALAESFETMFQAHSNLELLQKFQKHRVEFHLVLDSSERAQAVASTGHVVPIQDTVLQNLRHYFLLGMVEDRLGYEPTYLVSRGTSLTNEIRVMADWRNSQTSQYSSKDLSNEPDEGSFASLDHQESFNLAMNLLAAFLYCMNYYIVEPSSTMYVNALGGQDAFAGALIGMMPMASFISAIAFSIWTNYSFRQPFLVSCLLMLSGNLIYSYAYNFKSLGMAFVGRFLTGLGGPKCIIRRYMADTTSLSIRTSVNAMFGMVVAAGSAFGPGCAIMLNQLDFSIHLPGGQEIWMNSMTGPGYFMAILWSMFALALWLEFQEPERTGLNEQMKLERQETKDEATESVELPNEEHSHSPSQSLPSSDPNVVSRVVKPGCGGTNDDVMTVFSGTTTNSYETDTWMHTDEDFKTETLYDQARNFSQLVTFPVRICLGLLFAKVFVIETLVSSTSTLSKNRYRWQIREVGILGCVNGFFVIPLSIFIGRLSMTYQDRALMVLLLGIGLVGVLNLIDVTDLITDESVHYNEDMLVSVGPLRYVLGYFVIYMSIQSFEGIIGSALSKLIPTALASGTLNSGLLATLVDTFGRSCGDLFICLSAFIDIRQLMNLLFIPGALLLITCLLVVRKYYDLLAV